MNRRKTGSLAALSACMILLSSCAARTDEFITSENVNLSSTNVSEAFFQSVFTDDFELFEACYPDSFKDFEDDEGNKADLRDVFDEYVNSSDTGMTYGGAVMSRYNDYTEENGYDLEDLKSDIALLHHTDPESVEAARIVKLRLYFDGSDGSKYTTDVYILVYKSDQAWYVFELQNSDAEFAV